MGQGVGLIHRARAVLRTYLLQALGSRGIDSENTNSRILGENKGMLPLDRFVT